MISVFTSGYVNTETILHFFIGNRKKFLNYSASQNARVINWAFFLVLSFSHKSPSRYSARVKVRAKTHA